MNRLLFSLLAPFVLSLPILSCAETDKPTAQKELQLTLDKVQLELVEQGGTCSVVTSTDKTSAAPSSLDMPWPCRFHKEKTGDIRIIREAGYAYILVESSKPKPDSPAKDCETHIRAIRVKDAGITISPHQDRVAACPPFQWDTFVFKALFD